MTRFLTRTAGALCAAVLLAGAAHADEIKVLTTGTGGRWGRTLAPVRTTDYKASFFGSADHLGATAGPIRVRVARAP